MTTAQRSTEPAVSKDWNNGNRSMHEEKEQHNLWLVGQIYIFGIFQRFFFLGKKTTLRRVHLLFCIVVTLPVSHLDRSELKADAWKNAARSAPQHSKRTTTPILKNTTSSKNNKKSVSPPILVWKRKQHREEYTYCLPYWWPCPSATWTDLHWNCQMYLVIGSHERQNSN